MPVENPTGEGVVVESGPVVYDDAAADDEEEEEEEPCVSAMELMGSNSQFNTTHTALHAIITDFKGTVLRF